MSHYCGIDLHSNNHVVVMIDDEDKRVLEKRLISDLSLTKIDLSQILVLLINRSVPVLMEFRIKLTVTIIAEMTSIKELRA